MQKLFMALSAAMLLTACAGTGSPGDSERFKQGRDAYLSGDYSEAFERLITEADAGNPDAQYTIGYMYYEGLGVSRDEERALGWIRRAADNGSRKALDALGELASMGGNRPGSRPKPAEASPEGDQPAPADPVPDATEGESREELHRELTDDDT